MNQTMRVLLVEDEAILAMNLEQMLGRMGYAVLPLAATGEQAIDLAHDHQPDIVIMDIHLAGEMNGLAAAEHIQAFSDVPIVYLTGHSDEATLNQATLTGPYAFLVKPVTPKELQACLEIALHRHEMDRKLRESEDRYRTIVENIPDALVIHDFTGTIMNVNEICCQMFGYARNELIGANVALLSSPDASCCRTGPASETGSNLRFIYETWCTTKNGRHIPVEVSTQKVAGESGEVRQCFLRDITERKEQEERIRKTNDKLEQAIAEKDKLFSIIAHDLRSPLIGLLAFIRMLSKKADAFSVEDLRKWAEEMQLTAEGVYELLENLLEWSSLQRGMLRFEPTPLVLADLVEQNMDLLRSVSQQKDISMVNQLPGNLLVHADDKMLKTLLRNLLANALKFSRPGGRVLVFAENQGAMVRVAVRDEGVGMEEASLANLFRQDNIQSRKGTKGERGTGLGLVLCAELIQRMDGKIWAQSTLGQGTTVFFTLPGAPAASRQDGM